MFIELLPRNFKSQAKKTGTLQLCLDKIKNGTAKVNK